MKTIDALILDAADRTPARTALSAGRESMSYGELAARVRAVAGKLAERGIKRGDLVAVCAPRDLSLVPALLGVLAAGAAYLPLDPSHPEKRLRLLVEDSGATLVLSHLAPDLFGVPTLDLDDVLTGPGNETYAGSGRAVTGKDLAYVIYTSGTTGMPKGVMIEHAAVFNFLMSMRRFPGVTADDRVMAVTPVSFDISVLELFLPLLVGGSVAIVPQDISRDAQRLAREIDLQRATFMQATPATWRMLVETGWTPPPGFRVLCGGEAFPDAIAGDLLQAGSQLVNLYGPTETAVWSAAHLVSCADVRQPIGRPIANTQMYILSPELEPLITGATGELYIGGAGVARGYHGRPGLTATSFVPDPFAKQPGARMYRTGDLGRVTPENTLECFGRIDTQVKIRGHRIELGEVESVIEALAGVSAAAVVAVPHDGETLRLVGYYEGGREAGEVRAELQQLLPAHMLPDLLIALKELPLSDNGKIDRKALPVPGRALRDRSDIVPPKGDAERLLAGIWQEVLGIGAIGRFDDFFELGGNSILATRVGARIKKETGFQFALRHLFDGRTVEKCAAAIRVDAAAQVPAIPRCQADTLDLLPGQEMLRFLDTFGDAGAAYRGLVAMDIEGAIDIQAFTAALNGVFARHDALRARFRAKADGTSYQDLGGPAPEIRVVDVADPDALDIALDAFADEAFDLDNGPLLRVLLACHGDGAVVAYSFHHIILDAWSFAVLAREISQAYRLEREGTAVDAAAPVIGYRDAVAWLSGRGDDVEPEVAWWTNHLRDVPPISLPLDFSRPPVPSFQGSSIPFGLDSALSDSMRDLAAEEAASPFMLLTAALSLTLGKLSGQTDVCVGTVVSGRDHPDLENLVGLFLNTVALRTDWSEDITFRELIRRARDTVLDAFQHQSAPFESVIAALDEAPDLSRQPVFQVMLILDNIGLGTLELGEEASWTYREQPRKASKFDLTVNLQETGRGMQGLIEFSTDLFGPETIETIGDLFRQTLAAMCQSPDRRIHALRYEMPVTPARDMPPAAELAGRSSGPDTLTAAFADTVAAAPDAIALVGAGGKRMTRRELWQGAAAVAAQLKDLHGVTAGDRVALLAGHDSEAIVGLLAVLMAGAAYVPLNPAHPEQRLREIVRQCDARLVLSDAGNIGRAETLCDRPPHLLDVRQAEHGGEVCTDRQPKALSYILFTSGTTGRPKGVMQCDENVLFHARTYASRLSFGEDDTIVLVANLAFDAAVMDVWGALVSGATLALWDVPENGVSGIGDWLTENDVSVWHSTPSIWRLVCEYLDRASPNKRLRAVVLGGEEARPEDVSRARLHFPDAVVINGLGPTESTLALQSAFNSAHPVETGRLPVGTPVDGVGADLVDGSGRPTAFVGELTIESPHLALGYWGDARTTANAFRPSANGRVYHTGDIARRRFDGQFEFLGRADDQLKINGVRVEPAETANRIAELGGVSRVHVGADQDARLAAWIVPKTGEDGGAARPSGTGPAVSIFFFGEQASQSLRACYDFVLNAARRADALGLHAVWTPERHFTEIAAAFSNPVVLASSLAGVTRQIGLRAGSVVLPLHHPLRVAEDWAMVDTLSGGRVGVSFAPGWVPHDFVFSPDDYQDRHKVTLARIDQVRSLWQGDKVPFMSGIGDEESYAIGPRPIQAEIPAWLTVSRSAEMFAEAGRRGLNILTSVQNQTREQLSENIRRYRQARELSGLDPEGGHVTVMMHAFVAQTAEMAEATARPALRSYISSHTQLRRSVIAALDIDVGLTENSDFDYVVEAAVDRYMSSAAMIGSPASLADRAMALKAIGVDEIAGLIDFGVAQDEVLNGIEQLALLAGVLRQDLSPHSIKSALSKYLPAAQVPQRIQYLQAIPLTSNGKIDARLLPATETFASSQQSAPVTELEKSIAALFGKILGVENVGAGDSFFALGGHSLLVMRLVALMREDLKVDLPLRSVFEHPSVRELAAAVAGQGGERVHLPPVVAVSREEPLPLSTGQERLWLLDQIGGARGRYNVSFVLRLRGDLDAGALARALETLARRHEALRMRVTPADEGYRQVFTAETCFELHREPVQTEEMAMKAAWANSAAAFDLLQEPPWRAALYSISPRHHVLSVVMHHIASDAWSTGVLARQLSECFSAELEGREPPVAETAFDYADFVLWERDLISKGFRETALTYWDDALKDLPAFLDLPLDRPRPAVPDGKGAVVEVAIADEDRARLVDLAGALETTPFVILMTVFQIVLARWSGQGDFCVGTPVAGRAHPAFGATVGYFSNMIALRANLHGDISFRDAVATTKQRTLEALEHQHAAFDQVVDRSSTLQDLSVHPIFQTVLAFEPTEQQSWRMHDLTVERLGLHNGTSKFDLALLLVERSDGIFGVCEYATSIFEDQSVCRLMDAFLDVLGKIEPETSVFDMPLLPAPALPADSELAACAFAGAARRIDGAVFEQVSLAGSGIAVSDGSVSLSYADLWSASGQVASRLVSAGVPAGSVVGVVLERSACAVIAQLGVLRAGCVVMPVETDYPAARIALMFEAGAARLVITDAEHEGLVADLPVLRIDDPVPATGFEEGERRGPEDAGAPAYLLFTSGSTGRPKGVLIPHGAVTTLMSEREVLCFGAQDTLMLASPLSFDASLLEIWGALLNGGRIAVLPAGPFDPDAIASFLPEAGVTAAWLTAGLLRGFLDRDPAPFEGLRLLVSGGDVFPVQGLSRFMSRLPGVRLVNGYGPSESTTFTTLYRLEGAPEPGASVPIGSAVAGRRAVVLDERLRPVPFGAPGELHIGGTGLALGYAGAPGRTAEHFVPDPSGGGRRLYQTGDRVRQRNEGVLEFLGRGDSQVKVRGFRVEPGEVEAALCSLPGVRDGAVAVHRNREGSASLVGHVVVEEGFTLENLETSLSDRLPGYMVPRLVAADALPLDANGKVDRRSLAELAPPEDAEEGAPARPGLEHGIASVWGDLLERDPVARDGNFFTLGGHSLLAMRAVTALRAITGHSVNVRTIFEYPTPEKLARHLQSRAGSSVPGLELPALTRRSDRGPAPLSFAQERLWTLEQLGLAGMAYAVPVVLRIEGALNAEALEGALADLLERHEVLRTRFCEHEDQVRQEVGPASIALRRFEGEAVEVARNLWSDPFDLAADYPVRAGLVSWTDAGSWLVLVFHHACVDAWSMEVLLRDLGTFYGARAGSGSGPEPLAVQYSDFAVWQRGWLQGAVLEEQVAYWRSRLAGAPSHLPLPADHARPSVQDYRGGNVPVEIDAELSEAVRAFAAAQGVTVFMVLLGAFQVLLARWSGQWDVTVGTPIANRRDGQLEPLVGFFANTLALRAEMGGEQSFASHVDEVRARTLEAFAHQDLPFEKLVEELSPERDLSRHPVFQAMLAFQGRAQTAPSARLEGLKVRPEPVSGSWSKFDLTLFVTDADGALQGRLEYASALFERGTAEEISRSFTSLLKDAIRRPDRRLAELAITSGSAQDTDEPGPNPELEASGEPRLEDLFRAAAGRAGSAPAVRCGGEELAYGRLLDRVDALSARLGKLGIGRGDVVGVLMRRGIDLPAAVLGILGSGAAYLPMDPDHPVERLRDIARDAGVGAVLTHSVLRETGEGITPQDAAMLLIDRPGEDPIGSHWGTGRTVPPDTAYVIYTSGSTGRPKGVVLPHSAVAAYLLWARDAYLGTQADWGGRPLALLHGSFAYDMSVTSLFLPLICGGCLEVLPDGEDLAVLSRVFAASGAPVVLKLTPAHALAIADQFDPACGPDVLVLGGEALPAAGVERLRARLPGSSIVNEYGPTETAVGCSVHWCGSGEADPVAIGSAITGARLRVASPLGADQPKGAVGELMIGGAGVAHGYLGRPSLTAERFVPDPAGGAGARAYRTGDIARRRADGLLEYLGRSDDQVKIRGYRVELGEVEAALTTLEGVRNAAVIPHRDEAGRLRLAGYFTGNAGQVDVAAALKKALPAYMVPSILEPLEEMPRTAGGKIDRNALARVRRDDGVDMPSHAEGYVETRLMDIWASVLGTNQISRTQSFFELGGDSIQVLMIVTKAVAEGMDISPRDVFETETIAELADRVRSRTSIKANRSESPVRDNGSSLPALKWFSELGLNEPDHWNMSALYKPSRSLSLSSLKDAIRQLLVRHSALRARYVRADGFSRFVDVSQDGLPDLCELVREVVLNDPSELEWLLLDAQRSLVPDAGRNLRATLIGLPEGGQRLSLVVHHLACDAVSARIIKSELSQLLTGERLPAIEDTAVCNYADELAAWASSARANALADVWTRELSHRETRLPRDLPRGENLNCHAESVVRVLSAELTKSVVHADSASLQGTLVAALAGALAEWTGERDLTISMEAHGRFAPDGIVQDVSGTVGWFTAFWPARFLATGDPVADALRMKERLRATPQDRTSYAALRWLGASGDRLGFTSEVSFNYLGKFPGETKNGDVLLPAPERDAPQRAARDRRPFVLDVNAAVHGGQMSLNFGYATTLHHRSTIDRVADKTIELLQRICERADGDAPPQSDGTPVRSDLPADELAFLLTTLQSD